MRCTSFALFCFAVGLLSFGCKSTDSKESSAASTNISADSILNLASQAYIYGYPLVLMDATKKVGTNLEVPDPVKAYAPINQFGHYRSFPDATFKDVVKPNCDTYYSSAWLDLLPEPIVLTVPNTNGRYYLLPMLDAFTNVFASPGKRTTGTEMGNFLITGPGFTGAVPQEMKQIKAPTNMVWIIGRTQTNSAKDGATVVKNIQNGYHLTPLSKWGTYYTPEKHNVDTTITKTPPPVAVEQMDVQTFFNTLNQLLINNPPATDDSVLLNKLKAIGVGANMKFSLSPFDSTTQAKLNSIPAGVHQHLREALTNMGSLENGWNVTRSGMGSYGTNYNVRALIALIGLGANLNADACYPNCQVDKDGNKLTNANQYIIHFEPGQTPPVNAFWSVTLYGPDDLFVANPINRFAIGDRDNLKYNKDGSLDIYIQKDNPGGDKTSNWLPAMSENFSLTMRLYWPKESFLDGSWKLPPVMINK